MKSAYSGYLRQVQMVATMAFSVFGFLSWPPPLATSRQPQQPNHHGLTGLIDSSTFDVRAQLGHLDQRGTSQRRLDPHAAGDSALARY